MSSDAVPISAHHHVRTLRVSIYYDGQKRVFDLEPRELRAIVIGEVADADVRIQGEDVPEIICHLEREGDAVYLVPAYADDLRVGGIRVSGVCVLPWFTSIEFNDVHFTVCISDREGRVEPARRNRRASA